MRFRIRILILLVAVFYLACDLFDGAPEGRIKIKNDFGGERWSTIDVSAAGFRYRLKARESVLLPRGTTLINFSYQARKELRQYTVACPENLRGGVVIKLIDVVSGRISGGCRTIAARRNAS